MLRKDQGGCFRKQMLRLCRGSILKAPQREQQLSGISQNEQSWTVWPAGVKSHSEHLTALFCQCLKGIQMSERNTKSTRQIFKERQKTREAVNPRLIYTLKEGSSNLSLEVQSAAEFSSNADQTHLPVLL